MNQNAVNRKNIKLLCWARGMSVTDLAQRIGKSRPLIYQALSQPNQYPGTVDAILHELENNKTKCSHPACPNR